MNTEKIRTVKEFKRASYDIFQATIKMLDIPPGELAEELGYNAHSYMGWKKEGKIPAVAALACEALQRRNGKGAKSHLLLIQVPDEQLLATRQMLGVFGVKITEIKP